MYNTSIFRSLFTSGIRFLTHCLKQLKEFDNLFCPFQFVTVVWLSSKYSLELCFWDLNFPYLLILTTRSHGFCPLALHTLLQWYHQAKGQCRGPLTADMQQPHCSFIVGCNRREQVSQLRQYHLSSCIPPNKKIKCASMSQWTIQRSGSDLLW